MASGCAVSVFGGSKWLLQFKNQDAREGLAISRLPPLRPSTSLPPSLLLRLARTPDRCRLFTVAAQDSNPRQQQQQQQELDVSVLRFTFGIPGLDESYLPRYIGIAFGFLIILNHVFSASPATPAQLRTEALGMCLAAFSTALPYLVLGPAQIKEIKEREREREKKKKKKKRGWCGGQNVRKKD
ncbi:protein COFACTOR ASSEMBLY OF COMPLEX C SUBUNIT B CCB2, chloroplastic-like [Musa acuminata AAA Group]|uniref:protein COFACTOR ASSEMBLY OF COMPLEX C SUBUNIT B CCB2, chloroplastic-like n=1 Tax=Musa acuminata AAA Group TaxID=214697 RepID=UPI0031D99824